MAGISLIENHVFLNRRFRRIQFLFERGICLHVLYANGYCLPGFPGRLSGEVAEKTMISGGSIPVIAPASQMPGTPLGCARWRLVIY